MEQLSKLPVENSDTVIGQRASVSTMPVQFAYSRCICIVVDIYSACSAALVTSSHDENMKLLA